MSSLNRTSCAVSFLALWSLLAAIVFVAVLLASVVQALAHDGYRNWQNYAGKGCCNDHDCRPIEDADIRTTRDHVEVRRRNRDGTFEWCPVKREHYLKTGNAPDWSTAHVCFEKNFVNGVEVEPGAGLDGSRCYLLRCFQPKPGG